MGIIKDLYAIATRPIRLPIGAMPLHMCCPNCRTPLSVDLNGNNFCKFCQEQVEKGLKKDGN